MMRRFLLLLAALLCVVSGAQAQTTAQKLVLLSGIQRPLIDFNPGATGSLPTSSTFVRLSQATDYSSLGLLTTVSSNVARLDYNPLTLASLGYLPEESRTNLALQSNQFDTTWVLTADAAIASAAGTSPDGSSNAWKLKEGTTTSALHADTQTIAKAASALAYSFTVFAKQAERTRIVLQFQAGANQAQQVFDLAGGQVGPSTATTFVVNSATITPVGGGWYRCQVNITTSTETSLATRAYIDSGSGTAAASITYAGTIGSGVLIYGADLEQATFPSAYIATTTGTVSRSADNLSGNAPVSAFPSGFTIIASGIAAPGIGSTPQTLFQLDDGTANNLIQIIRNTSRQIQCVVTVGGVAQATLTMATVADLTGFTVSCAGQTNAFSASLNSGAAVTASSGSLPIALTKTRFGKDTTTANQWGGWMPRVRLFNEYLPGKTASNDNFSTLRSLA